MEQAQIVLETGTQLVVAKAGDEPSDAVPGTVADHSGNLLTVVLERKLELVRPGILMNVRSSNCDFIGWGLVETVQHQPDGFAIVLSIDRWEDVSQQRSVRVRVPLRVALAYQTDGASGETKRTIGSLIDASLTGMRIRMRSPLPKDASVHATIYLKSDSVIELLGKVTRIIAGSEASEGGFEVGVSFVRFQTGYNELVALAWPHETEPPAEAKQPDVQSEAPAENADAQTEAA